MVVYLPGGKSKSSVSICPKCNGSIVVRAFWLYCLVVLNAETALQLVSLNIKKSCLLISSSSFYGCMGEWRKSSALLFNVSYADNFHVPAVSNQSRPDSSI